MRCFFFRKISFPHLLAIVIATSSFIRMNDSAHLYNHEQQSYKAFIPVTFTSHPQNTDG